MHRGSAIALAILCTLLPLAGQFYGDRAGGYLAIDFRAYYCASLAQREGRNAYFADSLRECESDTPAPYYRVPKNVTMPAPYPPYALAFFSPLTWLPFSAAVVLWGMLLAACVAAAAFALAQIARTSVVVAWGALALSLGLTSLTAGNVMPLGLAAIVVAALCAQRGRLILAVLLLGVAMIEPQIALPAVVAFFIGFPRARLGLAIAMAVLGAVSVASVGTAQTVAYVTTILPAHALSEVSRDNQYSLSTVLTALGMPDAAAVAVGTASYAIALAAGVLVALRLARIYGEPAFAVLVPAGFALLGGSFVHTGEIAAAVPATLLLFTLAQAYRAWIFAALVLLAVPWMLATSAAMFLAPLFPVAYLTYALWRRDGTAALSAALASSVVIAGLFALSSEHTGAHVAAVAHTYPPMDPRLAEASWRQFVLGNSTNGPVMWLLRLPTWIGLLAFAAGALALARKAPAALAPADARFAGSGA